MKDRFPRLPPGVTPSHPHLRGRDSEADRTDDDPPGDRRRCMVCCPPDKVAGRFKQANGDLDRLPYCDDHDADDLRAKLEVDRQRRDEATEADRY